MMYTFQPIVDQYWDAHVGFYIILTLSTLGFMFLMNLWRDADVQTPTVFMWTVILGLILFQAHSNSYRPEVKYENAPVIGNFVGFQSEGYNERSGKSRADYHYIYVIYEVEGHQTIFKATEGTTYPKRAQLYRNKTVDK